MTGENLCDKKTVTDLALQIVSYLYWHYVHIISWKRSKNTNWHVLSHKSFPTTYLHSWKMCQWTLHKLFHYKRCSVVRLWPYFYNVVQNSTNWTKFADIEKIFDDTRDSDDGSAHKSEGPLCWHTICHFTF